MPPPDGPNDGTMADPPQGKSDDELTYAVFMDASVENQVSVYLCSDEKLIHKTVVTGFKNSLLKGRFLVKQAIEGQGTFQMSGVFDNGVDAKGHVRQAIQTAFDATISGQTQKARNSSALDLAESGTSTVETAMEISSTGDFASAYRELGIAKVDPAVGTALVQRTVDAQHPADHGGSGKFETSRAYFDSAGQALKSEDVPAAASGGALAVSESDLPKLPPENFAVEFDPSDWDCSGVEDTTLDEAAIAECDQAYAVPFKDEDCDAYGVGVEEQVPAALEQRDQGPPELPPAPLDDQGI